MYLVGKIILRNHAIVSCFRSDQPMLPTSTTITSHEKIVVIGFPALYEGFGLPALEALAAGVPLLSSTTGALPEVTGEAALAIDPYDIDAIVHAIRRLDTDDALRIRLGAQGPVQAGKFSLTAYSGRIRHLYHEIARR